jgi:hypothetical protein
VVLENNQAIPPTNFMKKGFLAILGILFLFNGRAQPMTHDAVIVSLDLDRNGNPEVSFEVSATQQSESPEAWEVSMGLIPVGDSRVLRKAAERVDFDRGDFIGTGLNAVTNEFPRPPRPPLLGYTLSFLNYSATLLGEWQYQQLASSTFRSRSNVIAGVQLHLLDGVHFGWLMFVREEASDHAPFLFAGFNYHPVPGEPILAGEAPPFPSLALSRSQGGLKFTWDSRWGNLVLEAAKTLMEADAWVPVGESSGGPLEIDQVEDFRFFRLRTP